MFLINILYVLNTLIIFNIAISYINTFLNCKREVALRFVQEFFLSFLEGGLFGFGVLEPGFLCVAMAVLELEAGLEPTEICLPPSPEYLIRGVCQHCLAELMISSKINILSVKHFCPFIYIINELVPF